MITTLDIIDIIYAKLKGSDLETAITGSIHKLIRPVGSEVEDIVINCLPASNDQLQKATVNVNIYVKDEYLKIGSNQYMPHYTRLNELAEMAIAQLKNVNEDMYFYDITNQAVMQEREVNQHYVNVRIEFKYINL